MKVFTGTVKGGFGVAGRNLAHVMGLIDDRKALGPYSKLLVQVGTITALVIFLPELRVLTALGPIASTTFTILWITAIANAFNFLDNMDGLSAGVAAVCTAAFLVATLSIGQWFVAERGAEVAVSYLATTGSASGLDGYITVTRNSLATNPLFWSSTINPPDQPLFDGSPPEARDDFIGADVAPDGTPWASFYTSCRAGSTKPGCAGQDGDPQASGAVAGRLAFR